MYGGFIIVLLLGGIGAVVFGASLPGSLAIVIVALGASAFCAGLVHVGLRMWDQESSKKR